MARDGRDASYRSDTTDGDLPADSQDDGAPPARAVLVHPDGRRPVRVRTRAAGRHRRVDWRPDTVHRRDPRLGRRLPSFIGGDRREPGAQRRERARPARVVRRRRHPGRAAAGRGQHRAARDGRHLLGRWLRGRESRAALHRRRSAADLGLPPGVEPADRRDAPAGAHRSRRRPVRPPADRRRLPEARRVVPRVPRDGPPRVRFLRPLDHRSRIPALLPHAAAVLRRRDVGLADLARWAAPSADRPGGARDRRDEGQARPRRPLSLSGAAMALPRGSDEAP